LIYEEADVNKEDEKQRSPMALTTLFDCISKDKLLKMIDEGIAYRKRRHLEDPVTKAKITQAVALFNNKPKKGLQFLVDEKVIPDTTTDKAEFLLTNKKLDKVKIGEILGEPDETALLTAFVDLLEFRGMEVRGHPTDTHTERERAGEIFCVSHTYTRGYPQFDQALRKFLSFFRLPGEAQKIDRMMMAFAQRYHAHNSDSVFASGDAAYVLAFSTIMLNTDAHNPAIRKQNKMTKVQFIGNNRGINEGADLPADFLSALYDRIIEDEIKLDDSNSTYANAEKKGYLTKQGGRIKTWKRRWFVLTNNCLYYFKDKGVCRSTSQCGTRTRSDTASFVAAAAIIVGQEPARHHSAREPGDHSDRVRQEGLPQVLVHHPAARRRGQHQGVQAGRRQRRDRQPQPLHSIVRDREGARELDHVDQHQHEDGAVQAPARQQERRPTRRQEADRRVSAKQREREVCFSSQARCLFSAMWIATKQPISTLPITSQYICRMPHSVTVALLACSCAPEARGSANNPRAS